MAVMAALYRDVRSAERHEVALDGTLRNPDWKPFDVVVDELSSTGFRVPATTHLDVGAAVSLGLPGVGMCPAQVVRRTAEQYGCVFSTPLSPDQFAAALRATAAQTIVLSPLAGAPLLQATIDAAEDRSIGMPLRALAVVGLAGASWAGLIAASNLFGR